MKRLREQKGFSQAEVAERLHVVRQTVSKWEKGHSAPDADMLVSLAAVLEVSASDLIGEEVRTADNVEDLALQTALINEQLTIQNRRIDSIIDFAKRVGLVCLLLMLLGLMVPFLNECSQGGYSGTPYFTVVEFNFHGEANAYEFDAWPDDPNRIADDPFYKENLALALDVPPEEIPLSLDPDAYADDPDSMANYLTSFRQYIELNGGKVVMVGYWNVGPDGNLSEPYMVLPG